MLVTGIAFIFILSAVLTSAAPYDKRASFTKANGQAAKVLQAHFATLTESSPCTTGQNACLQDGRFAQCVGGQFVATPCGSGLTCQALPLVNSPGTSVTCDSPADGATRIINTGARRSLSFLIASVSLDRRASFTKANGQVATALQAQFATLTESSPCTSGQNACLQDGKFAQCVGGKFVATPCTAGLTCQAVPLVNSPGTSITCDPPADAAARIAATGAKLSIPLTQLEISEVSSRFFQFKLYPIVPSRPRKIKTWWQITPRLRLIGCA